MGIANGIESFLLFIQSRSPLEQEVHITCGPMTCPFLQVDIRIQLLHILQLIRDCSSLRFDPKRRQTKQKLSR